MCQFGFLYVSSNECATNHASEGGHRYSLVLLSSLDSLHRPREKQNGDVAEERDLNMAYIGTGVQHALHSLLYLAPGLGGVKEASVSDLAELQGISAGYLAKLMTKLRRAGLVTATEGIHGGFTLARAPHSITVAQVVDAIGGDTSLFKCKEIQARCLLLSDTSFRQVTRNTCAIQAIMQVAEQCVHDELCRHTVADLAQRMIKRQPAMHRQQVMQWFRNRAAMRGRSGGK
jgi:Rrf2 family protein